MSWSVTCIGTPEMIAADLDEQLRKLNGQSRLELADALPHLVALVMQNFTDTESGKEEPLVRLEASGSGSSTGLAGTLDSRQLDRSCVVKIERFYDRILS